MLRILAAASIVSVLAFGAAAQRDQPDTAASPPPAAGPSVGSRAEANRLTPDSSAGAEAFPRPATSNVDTGVDNDNGIPGFSPGNCRPFYSSETGRIGPVTGDPEKDTIGRVTTDPCRQ